MTEKELNEHQLLVEEAWQEILWSAESVWEDTINEGQWEHKRLVKLEAMVWKILQDSQKFKEFL